MPTWLKSAPCRLAPLSLANHALDSPGALFSKTPKRTCFEKFAPERSAQLKSGGVASCDSRIELVGARTPPRSVSFEDLKSDLMNSAPNKFAPSKEAWWSEAPEKFAFASTARSNLVEERSIPDPERSQPSQKIPDMSDTRTPLRINTTIA